VPPTLQFMIPEKVRELAEEPTAHSPVPPGFERIFVDSYCLFLGPFPNMTMAQRLRLETTEVAQTVEEVRRLVSERGRSWLTWWLTESTTPTDLEERLLAMGMERAAMPIQEPFYAAMALIHSPGAQRHDVQARLVETFEDFQAANEIFWEAFEMTEEQRQTQREVLPFLFELHRQRISATYLCSLEGKPVASATAVFTEAAVLLLGGAVLPEARGRGCYRALVQARWEDAVARGTPALVVQAGAMSQPILERLGFQQVATMRVLVDRFA
jgi:Acetyltransferase (GNAT) family